MRFLDHALADRYCFPIDDFAIPVDTCCNFHFGNNTGLIVENEMTFLTLPQLPGTIALFGAGDAAAPSTPLSPLADRRPKPF